MLPKWLLAFGMVIGAVVLAQAVNENAPWWAALGGFLIGVGGEKLFGGS